MTDPWRTPQVNLTQDKSGQKTGHWNNVICVGLCQAVLCQLLIFPEFDHGKILEPASLVSTNGKNKN